MLIRQPLKMKNGCEHTKNRIYTIFEPLLQFNEALSLQCFRTAALSMITLNMESRNPMGRVYAENLSKIQKLLGVKGLKQLTTKSTVVCKVVSDHSFCVCTVVVSFVYVACVFIQHADSSASGVHRECCSASLISPHVHAPPFLLYSDVIVIVTVACSFVWGHYSI